MPGDALPRRRLVYVSGTRADFGLMKATLLRLAQSMDLSVAVTGMHLAPRFGQTIDDIRAAGLRICGEVAVDVETRTPPSMSAAIGHELVGLTDVLARERPDIVLLLGDRGEMLAGAVAALHLGIVSVHLHGGERSGTVDEPVRHAISKLCTYHLVASAESRERLIRMGEAPDRVVVTGAPGLDGLVQDAAMPAPAVREALDLAGDEPFLLALFHPVVQQSGQARVQTLAVLDALHRIGLPVVWLEPNADAGSLGVLQALDERGLPPGSRRLVHLSPRALFVSAMRQAAVLVGNSSAGIIEAASLGTPVVNVGDRQRQRERNANVTDVQPLTDDVHAALVAAIAHGPWPCENRYGDGQAGARIAQFLLQCPLDAELLEKSNFY